MIPKELKVNVTARHKRIEENALAFARHDEKNTIKLDIHRKNETFYSIKPLFSYAHLSFR